MMNMWKCTIRRLATEETAVTSTEYALIAALIAIVCTVALIAVGTNLGAVYTNVCNQVSIAVTGAPAC